VLVLDSGNALVRKKGWSQKPDAAELARRKARADLVLRFLVNEQAHALNLGPQDLMLGLRLIRKLVAQTHAPVISSNILNRHGKRVFPAGSLVTIDGVTIGLVGATWLSRSEKLKPSANVKLANPDETVPKAVADLKAKGATLFILLAAMDVGRARSIMNKVPEIALSVVSGRGGWLFRPQKADHGYIIGTPPGGKYIGVAELHIVGNDLHFQDLSQVTFLKTRIAGMLGTWKRYEDRAKTAKGPTHRRYERRAQSLRRAVLNMLKSLRKAAAGHVTGSYLLSSVLPLGVSLKDESTVKAMVDQVKKTYKIDDLHSRRRVFPNALRKRNIRRISKSRIHRLKGASHLRHPIRRLKPHR